MTDNPIKAFYDSSWKLADDVWQLLGKHQLEAGDVPDDFLEELDRLQAETPVDHARARRAAVSHAVVCQLIEAHWKSLTAFLNAAYAGRRDEHASDTFKVLGETRRSLEPFISVADRTADNSRKGKRKLLPEDEHFMGAVNYIRATKGKPGSRIAKVRAYLTKEGLHPDMAPAIDKKIQRYRKELNLT